MREFLDSILTFIATESLTDAEFATVTATHPLYDQSTYDDLSRILAGRENVSIMQDRLTFFYNAKGVKVKETITSSSNIWLGSPIGS